MKIGDILICKNNLYKYIKGEEYRITSIFSDKTIGVSGKVFETDESMKNDHPLPSKYHINDCFYMPNEIRKLKLKSIL